MTLHIVKEADPLKVDQVVILVYGQPGIGKTSIAQTAEAPLTLDFDAGIHRSAYRRDAVRMKDWSEVAALEPADIKPYKTIVVDTGGRALDKLTAHLIRNDPKLATSAGGLTLPGYGALKSTFQQWLKMLKEAGKDVVILAHDAEDKQGDDLIIRPDITGGSKQELIKVADAIGYLYRAQKGPVLDFNATDRWIGKNCAGFEPIPVPHLSNSRDFFSGVIEQTKKAINEQSEAQREAVAEVERWTADVAEIEDAADLSNLIPKANASNQRAALRHIVWNRAKELGLDYDKSKKKFVVPPEPALDESDQEAMDTGEG